MCIISVYHHPALVLMAKKDYMYHAKMDSCTLRTNNLFVVLVWFGFKHIYMQKESGNQCSASASQNQQLSPTQYTHY